MVFPKSKKTSETFRTVTHVLLRRVAAPAAAQRDRPFQMLVVSNMHVVSGSKLNSHRIPGNSTAKRLAFKQSQVTHGIDKAVRFASGLTARAAAEG